MTRVQVVYGLLILFILLVLSILSVTGVWLEEHSKPAMWYLGIAGLGFLYLFSLVVASSNSLGEFMNNVVSVASQKLGATD